MSWYRPITDRPGSELPMPHLAGLERSLLSLPVVVVSYVLV